MRRTRTRQRTPTPAVRIGGAYRFDYPKEFVTLPEYTAHAGQVVTAVRQLRDDEADTEVQPMYEVRAADGWLGHAFDDELIDLPAPTHGKEFPAWVALYFETPERRGLITYAPNDQALDTFRVSAGFVGLMGHMTPEAATADLDNWIATGFRRTPKETRR